LNALPIAGLLLAVAGFCTVLVFYRREASPAWGVATMAALALAATPFLMARLMRTIRAWAVR